MRKWDCRNYSDCLNKAAKTNVYNNRMRDLNFCLNCKKYEQSPRDKIYASDMWGSYLNLATAVFFGKFPN